MKYVLSLSDISAPHLKKVFEEGETKVYENSKAFERVFFVENIIISENKHETIEYMYDPKVDLRKSAIVEHADGSIAPKRLGVGRAQITRYQDNYVEIKTSNKNDGFLVFTDSYYPSWRVTLDGAPWTMTRVNYNFRGIHVPRGDHTLRFMNSIL